MSAIIYARNKRKEMFVAFFIIWILLNGNIAIKTVLLGIAFSAILYAFACKFLDFSFKKDVRFIKNSFLFIAYGFVLLYNIFIANFKVMKVIIDPKDKAEPDIVHFKTEIKSSFIKALLANAITITPGTITVSIDADDVTVHCLKKKYMEGFKDALLYKILVRMDK